MDHWESNHSPYTHIEEMREACTSLWLNLTHLQRVENPTLLYPIFTSTLNEMNLSLPLEEILSPLHIHCSRVLLMLSSCSPHAPSFHKHIWKSPLSCKSHSLQLILRVSYLYLATLLSLACEMKPCITIGWLLYCVSYWLPTIQYISPPAPMIVQTWFSLYASCYYSLSYSVSE